MTIIIYILTIKLADPLVISQQRHLIVALRGIYYFLLSV